MIFRQCYAVVGSCLITVISRLVVNRLRQRVAGGIGFCSGLIAFGRVILVFLPLRMYNTSTRIILTIVRINEHVEGIVVEFEILTVCLRHRTPYFQTTIVLVCLIVVTAIETILGTVVSRNDICFDYSSQRRIRCFVCIFLCLRHAVADIDKLSLAELDGARADISRSHIALHFILLVFRYCATDIQVNVTIGIFICDDIGFFEFSLSSWDSSRMICLHRLIGSVNILSDKVTYLILTLSENATCTTRLQAVGRSVFVTISIDLLLFFNRFVTYSLSVPSIPICRVVHPVGQHKACIVTHVVGRTIYEVEVHHLLLLHVINL